MFKSAGLMRTAARAMPMRSAGSIKDAGGAFAKKGAAQEGKYMADDNAEKIRLLKEEIRKHPEDHPVAVALQKAVKDAEKK
ncbi:hypothetical protein SARC_02565 [Sphaeroforma arctica JP610]|uniref:Uncharacterized protein n=1 Tax=Sphaeroforma arctica JP610 TaxID=667725 RepID=A0A0L0G8A4_9EUKA|nr:hypothetical protein SARC_02565 [Sphaeroforma arctica JP610]KNC85230.1 hypothetical protein SARC_02565 [Sphaeroforma arctica JP610]|eukprot:XP_014159132.1 hypothetical protein SARC_02565 [Sphaeroforma arctica JP610]